MTTLIASGTIGGLRGPGGDVTPSLQTLHDEAVAAAATSTEAAERATSIVVVPDTGVPDASGGFIDPKGFSPLYVDPAGRLRSKDYEQTKATAQVALAQSEKASLIVVPDTGIPDDRSGFIDPNGFIPFLIDADGTPQNKDYEAVKALAQAGGAKVDPKRFMLLASVAHVIWDGQSLALGVNAGATILSPTANLPWAKMFAGGIRSRDATPMSAAYNAHFYDSLTGLHEAYTATDDGYGELGAYGFCEMLAQLLQAENGIDISTTGLTVICSAPGEGSQPIATLQEGGTYWPRVQADLSNGQTLGSAIGLYLPSLLNWRNGERDTFLGTNPDVYKAALKQRVLAAMIEQGAADTGADRAWPCITYQLSSHRTYGAPPLIAQALVELCEQESNFALSATTYPLPHATDGKHLTNTSYRRLGGYEAIAAKRWLFDGVEPRHLRPLAETWGPNWVAVPFDVPVGKLTLDTGAVTNPGNYGFALVDNTGAAIAISSVTLVGNRVLIKAGAAIPSGSQLQYAWGTAAMTTAGPTAGPRGNLRDQQGDSIVFHGDRMDNWCPIFSRTKP